MECEVNGEGVELVGFGADLCWSWKVIEAASDRGISMSKRHQLWVGQTRGWMVERGMMAWREEKE